jgi:hypothetical protein
MIRSRSGGTARRLKGAAALVLLIAGTAGAVAQETGSVPLQLRVRPSGADGLSDEARARQERLEARMRRNEFLFRSICRTCSPGDRFESTAPFYPNQALRVPVTQDSGRADAGAGP